MRMDDVNKEYRSIFNKLAISNDDFEFARSMIELTFLNNDVVIDLIDESLQLDIPARGISNEELQDLLWVLSDEEESEFQHYDAAVRLLIERLRLCKKYWKELNESV